VGVEQILEDTYQAVRPLIGSCAVAEYIPRLAAVNADQFGMAVVMNDGRELQVGDSSVPFSVQSMSKVLSLVMVLADHGEDIWQRVGREPSGAAVRSCRTRFSISSGRNQAIQRSTSILSLRVLRLSIPTEMRQLRTYCRAWETYRIRSMKCLSSISSSARSR